MSIRERELAMQIYYLAYATAELLGPEMPNVSCIWFDYARMQNGNLRICYTIFERSGYRMLFQNLTSLSLEECINYLEKNLNPGDSNK